MVPRHQPAGTTRTAASEWRIRKIVVPVDFSSHSEKAVQYAAKMARNFDGELVLVHVLKTIPPMYELGRNLETATKLDEQLKASSEQRLQEFADRLVKSDTKVAREVRTGNPVEEIAECAREQAADLIITATHGRTGLKHVFLGSVAEGAVRYAPCPVLVTRNVAASLIGNGPSGMKFKTILVGVDFSESSALAMEWAQLLAARTGANLIITHVAPVHYPISEYGILECPQLDAELFESGRRHAGELVEAMSQKDIPTTIEIRQGNAGVELVEVANKRNVDLIIVGTRGLTGLKHALMGSTAEYVTRHAAVPVLTVREKVMEEGAAPVASTGARTSRPESDAVRLQRIVSSHPFLSQMEPEHLETILQGATLSEFAPGDIIFREGEYADKFYLVHEGTVALECHSRDHDIQVQTIGPGEVLGWSWLFPPFSWHFQARALDHTVMLRLNGAHILIATERDDRFGHQLMKRLAQVLIHRLQETRQRLIEQSQRMEVDIGDTL